MPEMPDELAGEFALGMLEEEERMVVERRMHDEPEFRRAVDFWSRRLIPLLDELPSLTPPVSVWAAIRGRLGDPMPPSSRRQSEGAWLNIAPGVQLKMLHVDPSFVTTQSKLLEKKGFIRRKASSEDARIVKMSLTDKTYKHLAGLASQQEALNEFIFAEFSAREIDELTGKLASLKKRLEKACLKVAVDF